MKTVLHDTFGWPAGLLAHIEGSQIIKGVSKADKMFLKGLSVYKIHHVVSE